MPIKQDSSLLSRQGLGFILGGIIFVLLGIFDRGWNWRGLLQAGCGIFWIILGIQIFLKAKKSQTDA